MTKILSALPAGSSSVLSDIFLKIGEPDKTKEVSPQSLKVKHLYPFEYLQGLNELYQFRTSHPTFDLDSVLAGQTKFYREYILRGLRTVETGVAIRSKGDQIPPTHMHTHQGSQIPPTTHTQQGDQIPPTHMHTQ